MEKKILSGAELYLEIGQKRVFAGAIAWPGWCRPGRDEQAALQALLDYGPRYAHILRHARLDFRPPGELAAFTVVERLTGTSTTDFGAPDVAPSADSQALDEAELQRYQAVLTAAWQGFDAAVTAATGKTLRKGPRGGGRELDKIVEHVLGADEGYLARLGQRFKRNEHETPAEVLGRIRQAILETLAAAAQGELPERGPRGGLFWSPRYFVRRVAWHVIDHIWEIEERVGAG